MHLSDYQIFKNYLRPADIFCVSHPTGEISISVSIAAGILTRIIPGPLPLQVFSCLFRIDLSTLNNRWTSLK
jgi:hypothetical protein